MTNRTSTRQLSLAVAVVAVSALLLSACGGDDRDASGPIEASGASTSAPETTTPNDIADAAGGLINCESNIDDAVPDFYRTYFRCTDIAMDGDAVVISGANLPPHLSYYYGENSAQFEPFDFSRGDEYRPNPNEIAERTFIISVPVNPIAAEITIDEDAVNLSAGDATDYPFGTAGVALDGVALFNPLAAPGDDIEDEKFTFDSNEGHPQQQGTYHYHAVATGPLTVLQSLGFATSNTPGEAETELYGVMCDGTAVMGTKELDGSTPDSGIDLQAGHVHDVIDAGGNVLLAQRYHIHMARTIGASPRGLTPEAQYYSTCDVTAR